MHMHMYIKKNLYMDEMANTYLHDELNYLIKLLYEGLYKKGVDTISMSNMIWSMSMPTLDIIVSILGVSHSDYRIDYATKTRYLYSIQIDIDNRIPLNVIELNYVKGTSLDTDSCNSKAIITNRRKDCRLKPKKVLFNGPVTIVFWNDGTKTIVKCQDGDSLDKEKGLVMAFSKKLLGNDGNYYETFKRWLHEADDANSENSKSVTDVVSEMFNLVGTSLLDIFPPVSSNKKDDE